MKDDGHRYMTDGTDVWCCHCGHEPWHRREVCPVGSQELPKKGN
jgi:hypothetical protein